MKRTVHEIHANGDFALTQRVNCDTACQTQHDVVTSWLEGSLPITCVGVFDAKCAFLEDQMLILNELFAAFKKKIESSSTRSSRVRAWQKIERN